MLSKQVGDFHITVSEPYPMWIAIECGGVTLRFPHRVLPDIEYAIAAAKAVVLEQAQQERRSGEST